MINSQPAGTRCLATKEIRTHSGLIKRFTEGTILYDLDNLGRHLIYVQWNNGVAGYVYPVEIETIGSVKNESARVS